MSKAKKKSKSKKQSLLKRALAALKKMLPKCKKK